MAAELFIPQLGQTVEEVTLVNWLKEDGAKVDFGEGVLEVETDKAIFPVEANAKGILHRGPYKAGDVLPVLAVVAVIGKPEDRFVAAAATTAAPAAQEKKPAGGSAVPTGVSSSTTIPEAATGKRFVSPRARKLAAVKNVDLALVSPTGGGGMRIAERDVMAYLQQKPLVTPVAQKMAETEGVDLRAVKGTGPGGRIVRQDVERSVARTDPTAAAAPAPIRQADVLERIPLKGVRAVIAERMGASVHTTARVTLMMDVDATEFVAARERLKDKVSESWGFTPGYNDLLAKIVAAALRSHPYMNARLASDAIEILAHVNLGMAVDTDRGLVVPVIPDADQKSLRQFGTEFREKARRAQEGRPTPDDLSGGTFTITNLGMYDIDAFTPVINLPEAAILGVGRIAAKPVAFNGAVVIRQMWTLSLVFDHRLVDGAPAARFLQTIKSFVEEPYMLITL